MRNAFCRALVEAANRPEFVFLTGDLGYAALEPLRTALGARFINAGVAEQNLVSVAAGLARSGLRPWGYSIAPFLYARALEQIRNDVCLHCLPVMLAGNGGGYHYGVMGATHHALDDYGILLALPHLRAYIPAFDDDVHALIEHLFTIDHPAYLRLGRSEEPPGALVPAYAPWRRLTTGSAGVVLAVGPLAGVLWAAVLQLPMERRPALWVVSELPVMDLPADFFDDVRRTQVLVVVEEHVAQGGVGRMLAALLLERGQAPARFRICQARGYVSGLYGSQQFHRRESGLDAATVFRALEAVDGP